MTRDDSDDEALADAARRGDAEAFAVLWERHARAGMAAARSFAAIADPDDLVAEASLRIFAALQRGGGPRGAFRPYLYRTIRNVALDWRRPAAVPLEEAPPGEFELPGPEAATEERTIGFQAFRSLPERWQSVLWYLDVEGMDPASVAPLLGLSPNAVSALAVRARDGLKKAWLQAHVNEGAVPEGCRWTTARMGAYVRGGLGRRASARFADHLAGCDRCRALLAEVELVDGRLAVLLLPLFLGGGAASALLAERAGALPDAGEAHGSPSTAGASARGALAASSPARVFGAIVITVVVAVVAVGAVAVSLPRSEEPSPPAAAPESPAAPEEPVPTPTPTQIGEEDRAPDDAPPRTAPPAPSVPVVIPPAVPPTAPAAPSAPTVAVDPSGRVAATGTGDEPGATIELWGRTVSLVTGDPSPDTLLASVVVAPDGTWTTPVAAGLTPINITAWVRQVREGLPSAPVELFADAFFQATCASTEAVVTAGTATWQLEGWPGAAWEVRDGGNLPVASGVFDAAGSATASVVLPAAPSGAVLSYSYGYVQDGALSASSPGLTATAP